MLLINWTIPRCPPKVASSRSLVSHPLDQGLVPINKTWVDSSAPELAESVTSLRKAKWFQRRKKHRCPSVCRRTSRWFELRLMDNTKMATLPLFQVCDLQLGPHLFITYFTTFGRQMARIGDLRWRVRHSRAQSSKGRTYFGGSLSTQVNYTLALSRGSIIHGISILTGRKWIHDQLQK